MERCCPQAVPLPLGTECCCELTVGLCSCAITPAPPPLLQVTIYRLVSKNTYEQNVFEISSRKYGAWPS